MTNTDEGAALEKPAEKAFLNLTFSERRLSVADALEAMCDLRFGVVHNLKKTALEKLLHIPVHGTAFGPVATHIKRQGEAAGTIGKVLQVLGLSQVTAHKIFCEGTDGKEITAAELAARMRKYAKQR
jgi:hypothetical protein